MRRYAAIAGELLICAAALGGAWWDTPEILRLEAGQLEFAALTATFFLFMQTRTRESGLDILMPVFRSTGMTLVVAALLSYTVGYATLPALNLLAGTFLATLGILVWRRWTSSWWGVPRRGILLMGQGPLGIELAQGLSGRLIGVVDASAENVPKGVPYLGTFDQAEAVIAEKKPDSIVIDTPDWQQWISPEVLLRYKLHGGKVETAGALHERVFQRIHPRVFQLTDVLWVETQKSNRRVMAIQAVYWNLIGLFLLVCSVPLLLILGIASRLQARGRTMFHRVECAGFQTMSFQLRRFHVRHTVTGELTGLGRIIEALRLTGLPQVINLVRGEMGLFGPEPVRIEFAPYLEQVCSLYSYRHSARPGLLGWARSLQSSEITREESLLLSYDLYYYEYATPALDVAILLRMAGRVVRNLAPKAAQGS